jgi:ubiquinone/menaquinone biosynthesis C-methylase UbiE
VAAWIIRVDRILSACHSNATEITAAIIEEAAVAPGFTVLDVACGWGIPALELAQVVGPYGSVTATDPSPIMIAADEENDRQRGLTNGGDVLPRRAGRA